MSGNLGLGEPFHPQQELEEVSVAAALFDKNRWDDIGPEVAHVLALMADGSKYQMKVRVLAQLGSGACDIEAFTPKLGELEGQVERVQLFVDGKIVADHIFRTLVPPGRGLAVQMRVVGVPEEALGALP